MKAAAVAVTVLGLVLVAASAVWGSLFPVTRAWTPEKATRISEIKARLNDLGFAMQRASTNRIHSSPDPATLKAEYDTLNKEFDQLKADFESADQRPKTASTILKWSGISLLLVGVIGLYAAGQSN
jgi:hypothetical protein